MEYLNEQIALIVNSKVRTLEIRIIPNKKAPEGANLLNGAGYGSLLELFNKTLRPVLVSSEALLLYYAIGNYINGVEKEN